MAFFNIRQWIDRISEHPNRRTLTNVEDPTDVKTYDLDRAEGEVSVRGTAITGANLTDLENRIGAAFTAVENAMPEANPAEDATASLTKLKVDGTVYEVEGGGGGTTIEKITKAEWDAMTAEEREAFIGVVEDTNADYVPLTADNIPYDSENSIAEKVESKVANVAFDSSTMFADISAAVKNAFNLTECYCYVLKNENVCTVTLRFKCANAIASGSFDITGLTPCKTDVTSALASLDNKGGYMQLSGTILYIRSATSSSQYLAGSITYPTYTN